MAIRFQSVVKLLGVMCLGLLFSAKLHAAVDEIFADTFGDARMILNEVNANITGSQDLIELRAVVGGTMLGIEVVQNPDPSDASFALLATLPDTIVAAGDLIVVHLNAGGGLVSETGTKLDCIDAACYPGAWDVLGGATGISYSSRVLAVQSAAGILMDAVPFARTDVGDNATYPAAVQYLQSLAYWFPADCNGALCNDSSTPSVVAISADWTALGSSSTGASVSRRNGMNTHSAGDWQVTAQTFGADNP
jgi:hypothetical protein